jgi:hypothetical protein
MRSVFISILSVFIWMGAGVAQERGSFERAVMRVGPATGSSTVQPIQSPVLGFISSAPAAARRGRRTLGPGYSSTGAEVRAILGVPGAAMLSGPVALPRGVESVYFPPGENYALLEQSAGSMGLVRFSGEAASALVAVAGTISRPEIVSFSPRANAAAVFSAEAGRLQIISGLPESPQLSRDLSAADLPDGIEMLALADDGMTLLAGASDGQVLVLRAGNAPELLYSAGDLGGIAFAPGSTNALVFDRNGSRAILLQNVASAPSTRVLAEGLTGLSGAIVLQFDGGAAIAGAVNAKQLSRIDLQTLHVDQIALPVGLTMLQPLRLAHRFLVSAQGAEPAWILDTSEEAGAVYFVPRQAHAVMAR